MLMVFPVLKCGQLNSWVLKWSK